MTIQPSQYRCHHHLYSKNCVRAIPSPAGITHIAQFLRQLQHTVAGSFVYTKGCAKVQNATISTSGDVTTITFNACTAGTYIIGVKYDTNVTGFSAPSPATTVHYDFTLAGFPAQRRGLIW